MFTTIWHHVFSDRWPHIHINTPICIHIKFFISHHNRNYNVLFTYSHASVHIDLYWHDLISSINYINLSYRTSQSQPNKQSKTKTKNDELFVHCNYYIIIYYWIGIEYIFVVVVVDIFQSCVFVEAIVVIQRYDLITLGIQKVAAFYIYIYIVYDWAKCCGNAFLDQRIELRFEINLAICMCNLFWPAIRRCFVVLCKWRVLRYLSNFSSLCLLLLFFTLFFSLQPFLSFVPFSSICSYQNH